MIKSKKQMFIVIGVFTLVILLGTVTYAFFNYTRTGAQNTIRVGRISFVSKNEETISLNNLFPIDPTETGIMNDATKVGTYEVEIKGDTDYVNGLEYLITTTNANVHTIKKKEEEEDQFDLEKELEFLNSYENKLKKGLYPSYNYNQMRYQYKPVEQQFFGSTVERGITHIPFNEKILYPGPGSYFHQTFRNFEKRKNLKKIYQPLLKVKEQILY